ncbi:hypothetical protein FA10DRAFT_263640 [Acaromyces ingoldii]|uniref:Uncharacterized protein n=1 Tax=Acaromyces ingoldii TaxID=215250 RepID=A0A316YXU7_9BASI|nr:hypothetical protein FA10DRAFT_263640 [Acaromyces ingoldii]PWN92903.1 hypothetical protein FA10DRAFT_263640 [Acaromyces ingoldii]
MGPLVSAHVVFSFLPLCLRWWSAWRSSRVEDGIEERQLVGRNLVFRIGFFAVAPIAAFAGQRVE